MKHKLQYPFTSISGVNVPTRDRIFYPWREIQCSRSYAKPNNTGNTSYNSCRSWQEEHAEIWTTLDPWDQDAWRIFADAWNKQINPKQLTYSAYSAFLAVNYYRRLSGNEWGLIPPTVKPWRYFRALHAIKANTTNEFSQLLIYPETNPGESGYCLIKTSKPYSNIAQIPKYNSYAMINGTTPESIPLVRFHDDGFLIENTNYVELYQEGKYVSIITRAIDADFFPHQERIFQLIVAGEIIPYSAKNLTEWYSANQLCGFLQEDNPGWPHFTANYESEGKNIIAHLNGARARFRIPLKEGSFLTSITLTVWTGGTGIDLYWKFIKINHTVFPETESIIMSDTSLAINGARTILIELAEEFEILPDCSYELYCERQSTTEEPLSINALGITSRWRAL